MGQRGEAHRMGRFCIRSGGGNWMRPVGIALVFLGALLLFMVIPMKLWKAFLGTVLIVLGAILLRVG